ncbi:MAG: threonine/serine exporter family protein [Pseudomonadota bacterium]
MDTEEFKQKRRFIVKLGKMLHRYGTPAFRLEAYLADVAEYLDLRASFNSTPTSIIFVIWSDNHEEEYTHAARLAPGDIDLNSLACADALAMKLLAGELSLSQAERELERIDDLTSPYNRSFTACGFAMSTGAFAALMGAGAREIVISALLGALVYLWTFFAEKSKRVNLMLEPVASFSVAFFASVFSHYFFNGLNVWLVILSSLIILVPGLSLTMGLAELSSRNLVSGTARVMDAVMQLFKLYFGAFIGIYLAISIYGEFYVADVIKLPEFIQWISVLALSLGLITVFKTRFQDVPYAISATFIAFAATKLSSAYLEQGLGAFVGAFVLGVYANLLTRISKKPSTIFALHGLIVLVPGSKTYIGLNAYISGTDFLPAEHVGPEIFLILMSLVAGLIFANAVAPTKKAL